MHYTKLAPVRVIDFDAPGVLARQTGSFMGRVGDRG
jgi:hypothetical protein